MSLQHFSNNLNKSAASGVSVAHYLEKSAGTGDLVPLVNKVIKKSLGRGSKVIDINPSILQPLKNNPGKVGKKSLYRGSKVIDINPSLLQTLKNNPGKVGLGTGLAGGGLLGNILGNASGEARGRSFGEEIGKVLGEEIGREKGFRLGVSKGYDTGSGLSLDLAKSQTDPSNWWQKLMEFFSGKKVDYDYLARRVAENKDDLVSTHTL